MKIAILSDIHSNKYALDAVIHDFEQEGVERIIVLGDIFGYYPWAVETYQALKPYLTDAVCILGNHDLLLLTDSHPPPTPSYWEAARQNKHDLLERENEALTWLSTLGLSKTISIQNVQVKFVHGTPGNAESGRYFPDNTESQDWFPAQGEVLLLGHTHYPLFRKVDGGGIIFNPGSVGQPRDGNPMPAWGLWDTTEQSFSFKRSNYDNLKAMQALEAMHWEQRAIAALNKTNTGKLNF